MIIAVKHSDLRVLDTVPLTSTIANQHKNVTFQQSEASPKKSSKFHHKVSNSGKLAANMNLLWNITYWCRYMSSMKRVMLSQN